MAALVFLLAFLAITVKYELPINVEVERWKPSEPPPDWNIKRQRWERWQAVQGLAVGSLACVGDRVRARRRRRSLTASADRAVAPRADR